MDQLSGSRLGNTLSELLGQGAAGAAKASQQPWREIDGAPAGARRTDAQQPALSATRLAAAERAGEAGERHPRGRFLDLKT